MNPSIWSKVRRPRPAPERREETAKVKGELGEPDLPGGRSIFQQDYDRLLFSTPVRRLADKTQVWPMDENDGVRTRLTHSHEVANLARSIGTRAFMGAKEHFMDGSEEVSLGETIQPMLLAIGLGHDLGNPPFGHQGELAIARWFERRAAWIFTHTKDEGDTLPNPVSNALRMEFTEFDGNPQSFRLITKLQTHIEGFGLDLSAATLAAGLKYPVHVSKKNKKKPSEKKGGYFESERDVIDWIRTETGLKEGQRHPLTWIMEACDDIAYSVLDVDDLLKKGIMSPNDVLVILRRKLGDQHPTVKALSDRFHIVERRDFVPEIQNDIKVGYLRALVIKDLILHAGERFVNKAEAIFNYNHEKALMDCSDLCDALKEVAKQNAIVHPTVLRTEALGAAAIDDLTTALWEAISDREDQDNLRSPRNSARAKYLFSLISPNYIERAVNTENLTEPASGLRYRELRLLTDMVSGMTDSFAMKLWKDIGSIPHANRT